MLYWRIREAVPRGTCEEITEETIERFSSKVKWLMLKLHRHEQSVRWYKAIFRAANRL